MTIFGVLLDDHFWPSIYPGLFIGLVAGLAARGLINLFAGIVGGTLGAVTAFVIVAKSGVEDGLLPLAALLAMSFAGASLFLQAAKRCQHPRPTPS